MKELKNMIENYGRVLDGNILKVDSFLNHQINPSLFVKMGKDFYEHFKNKEINKILTLEVSGIGMSLTTAIEFNVPLVFAKKIESRTLSNEVWQSKVISYTKNKEYTIKVDKKFLSKDDKVLIIDDFLANGKALAGLISLCEQAGAEVIGIGISIEKAFQEGGKIFRKKGYDLYSQARIKEFKNGKVVFI